MQSVPISTAPQTAGGQSVQATAKASGGAGATAALAAFAALLNGGAEGNPKPVLPAGQAAKASGAQPAAGANVLVFAKAGEGDPEAQLAALLQGQVPQDGKVPVLVDGEPVEAETLDPEAVAADAVAAASAAPPVQPEDAAVQAAGGISKAQKPTLEAPQGGIVPAQSPAAAPNLAELTRPVLSPALPADPIAAQPVQTDTTLPTAPVTQAQPTGTGASHPVATATAAAQHAAPAQPAAHQLAVSITRAAKEGADRIEIHLQPAELGKVDVKLEVGHDGRLLALISAERTDTLEGLRRDVHQLEKALNNAGLNTDRNSFSFAESGRDQQRPGGQANGGGNAPASGGDAPADDAALPLQRSITLDRLGVDLTV